MKELSFAANWYWFVLMAAVSYLIGCFNIAVIIAKARHKDVHKIGSGNPGSMNISREFGLKVGLLNFLVDVCKGGLPPMISYFIFRGYVFEGTQVVVSDLTRYLCGCFVVIGHIYPVTMKFKGGKGIAATFGMFLFSLGCENPWYLLVVFGGYLFVLGFIVLTEVGSMASLLGVTGFSIWQCVEFFLRYETALTSGYVIALFALILLVNFLTWFAHRKNIMRFYSGEEHRTSVKKLSKGKRGMQNL
ncbi:MAG: glycerol-3-phosphate acyltransferase [Candidatus Gallimonas sp.]